MGVVGYGFIAERGHVPAYRLPGPTKFEIAALADTCAARREKARADLPGARIYASVEEMLEAEDGRIDCVDVCAPPSEHAPAAALALSRGLHVLCEKPLTIRAEDARALVALARRERRVIFPSHNYKHAPVVKEVRRVLDRESIGRVHLVTLQTFRPTHARGVPEFRPDWRRERRWSGGGIGMDHGSHTLYLAFDWLGGYPESITAKTFAFGEFDTEDNFFCTMTFPNGIATAHLSWTAGVRKVLYTVHGERGTIRVEEDDIEIALRRGGPPGAPLWKTEKTRAPSDWTDASHVHWFRSLFDRFAAAIANGEFAGRETEASVCCVETIQAAYASASDGARERPLPFAARQHA